MPIRSALHAAALLAASPVLAQMVVSAQGSAAERYPVGSAIPAGDSIDLRPGDKLTVMDGQGTRVLQGPLVQASGERGVIGGTRRQGATRGLSMQRAEAQNAYGFTMTGIDGEPLPLARYKGRVLLVVNTASQCGFTPQYEGLQALYESYQAKGLTVVGVPSNDFGGQEPGKRGEIKQFCQSKFGIRFPMTDKYAVTGTAAAPFYQWARTTLGPESEPKWNFHKYLVGRDGRLIGYYGSKVTPQSSELTRAVEKALSAS